MADGLLRGLKVLEVGDFISAPYCTKLLADMGAEVIKIESLEGGDSARSRGPFPGDIPHPEKSGLFLFLNMNKRGITLNLGTATGRDILGKLVGWADVLVENLGPSRAAASGIDFDSLRDANPDLVLTSVSAFGQTGPYRDYQAPDLVSFHMSGYAQIVGGAVEDVSATPPLKAAEHQADYVAAVNSALATVAGLLARQATGSGQRVDVSKQESMVPFVFGEVARYSYEGKQHTRALKDNPANGVVAVLPTADGHVAISPREDHLWARWLEVMGNPEWGNDERFQSRQSRIEHWAELEPLIAEWTGQRKKYDVFLAAQAARVPSFPVNTMEDIFASEQLRHRGFFASVEHPVAGELTYPTMPYKLSSMAWSLRRPAPLLGEHNYEVYCGLLGYTPEALALLRQAHIV
jgi:CoA:oxalate CoA-transferase